MLVRKMKSTPHWSKSLLSSYVLETRTEWRKNYRKIVETNACSKKEARQQGRPSNYIPPWNILLQGKLFI